MYFTAQKDITIPDGLDLNEDVLAVRVEHRDFCTNNKLLLLMPFTKDWYVSLSITVNCFTLQSHLGLPSRDDFVVHVELIKS